MYEIVERKGIGHPDTLTDTVVEACASFLDTYYVKKYGKVLHYNVDKALFLGGDLSISFNKVNIRNLPIFILGGQISKLDANLRTLLEVVIKTTVNKVLPNLDFNIKVLAGRGSTNLEALTEATLCNDTSFAVGYYPLSEVESQVFKVEQILQTFDKLGSDYKILNSEDEVIISAPVIYNTVPNVQAYFEYLTEVTEAVSQALGKDVTINPEDDVYLTYSGSSIECGDDGQVGRGNRYNGLITPCRPMTMEAYSGKNNHSHIGKLYQRKATELAKARYVETGVPTQVLIYGVIGTPIEACRINYSKLKI